MSRIETILENLGLGKKRLSKAPSQATASQPSLLDQKLAEFEEQKIIEANNTAKLADNMAKLEAIDEQRGEKIRTDFQNEIINPAIKHWQETVPPETIALYDEFARKVRDRFGGPAFTKEMQITVNSTVFPAFIERNGDDWRKKEDLLRIHRNPQLIMPLKIETTLSYGREFYSRGHKERYYKSFGSGNNSYSRRCSECFRISLYDDNQISGSFGTDSLEFAIYLHEAGGTESLELVAKYMAGILEEQNLSKIAVNYGPPPLQSVDDSGTEGGVT